MGDPETQPIMMRLKTDLFEVLLAATDGTLDQVELQWDRRIALGVVMAAHGYPLNAAQGRRHHRPARGERRTRWSSMPAPRERDGDAVHHRRPRAVRDRAGRHREDGAAARLRGARRHRFDGAQYRSDIGHRAIKR